jgi:hypothetical protein
MSVKRYTDYGGLIELDCSELSPMSGKTLVLASDYDCLLVQFRLACVALNLARAALVREGYVGMSPPIVAIDKAMAAISNQP